MIALTKKFYRDHRLGILLTTLGLIGMQGALINLYPVFKEMGIGKVSASQPKMFQAFFGTGGLSFTTIEGFLRNEYLTFTFIVIIAGYLIALVTYEFTKEIEAGTIESLLSLPVSRTSVVLYKLVNITLLTAFFTVAGIVPFLLMAKASGYAFSVNAFVVVIALSFVFFWAIAALTAALSVFFSERNKPVFIVLFILAFGYILNTLTQAFDKIKDLRILSLLYYYDTVKALADKTIGFPSLAVFGIIIVTSIAFALYRFDRRDFSVT